MSMTVTVTVLGQEEDLELKLNIVTLIPQVYNKLNDKKHRP